MWTLRSILIVAPLYFAMLSQAQFSSSLPECIRDCIDQSQFNNCLATDIGCLCRASAGNLLPDLLTCMRGKCDLDGSVLLEPLQALCVMAGAPIPEKALQNAGNHATSVQQVTTTMTVGSPSATGHFDTPATFYTGYSEVTTITAMKTEDDGLTVTIAYPVTVWQTATIFGFESTITSIHTLSSATSHMEDSKTTTFITRSTPHPEFTSLVVTTRNGAQTSSSVTKSTTTPAASRDEVNSAPFKDTNSSGTRKLVGKLIGLTGLLIISNAWF